MRSIVNQFIEFLSLSYKVDINKLNNQPGDECIGNTILLRKTKVSWDFIILTNGNSISIPYILVDLFQSFDVYYRGEQYIDSESITNSLGSIIQLMMSLVRGVYLKDLNKVLGVLDLLQSVETSTLFQFIEEHSGVRLCLPGIIYITREKTIFI